MMRDKKIQPIDEEFAVAADAFFSGDDEVKTYEDAELSALMDTVARVDDAFSESDVEEAKERIRKQVNSVWFAYEVKRQDERLGFFDQVREFFLQNKKPVQLAFSFVIALLIFAFVPFLFNTDPNMVGTANGFGGSETVTIVLLIGLISALFVILGRQNK